MSSVNLESLLQNLRETLNCLNTIEALLGNEIDFVVDGSSFLLQIEHMKEQVQTVMIQIANQHYNLLYQQ